MSLPTLNDYCLLEKIGIGSYATVYKAFKKVCADLRFGLKTTYIFITVLSEMQFYVYEFIYFAIYIINFYISFLHNLQKHRLFCQKYVSIKWWFKYSDRFAFFDIQMTLKIILYPRRTESQSVIWYYIDQKMTSKWYQVISKWYYFSFLFSLGYPRFYIMKYYIILYNRDIFLWIYLIGLIFNTIYRYGFVKKS